MYFVYIMTNRSKSLYIGVTNNLIRRAREHKTGIGSGFTAKYKLDRLVYFERFEDVHPDRYVDASAGQGNDGTLYVLAEDKVLVMSATTGQLTPERQPHFGGAYRTRHQSTETEREGLLRSRRTISLRKRPAASKTIGR
jgi:hypothetical protein